MGYTDVIKKIDEIENNDFTMDSLRSVGQISNEINYIYGSNLLSKKIDAKPNFMRVKGKLNGIVFDKLKEKLGFEDEIIDQILGYIDFFHQVIDIYVLDGNIIIKFQSKSKDKEATYLVSNEFYDVSSKQFVSSLNYNVYKGFFVDALNHAMIPLFKESMEKSQLLNASNNEISYNLDDLNIYINKPLREIMQINTDVTGKVAKVLVKHDDELYYYDLKIHYAYFELARNNYKINKLSEMLDEKVKTKTLKNG